MKKMLTLITLASVIAISGCGTKKATDTTTPAAATTAPTSAPTIEPTAVKDPVELKIWTDFPNFKDAWEAVATDFQKQNPDIKVTFSHYPGDKYDGVLSTSLQASEGPDVFRTSGADSLAKRVKANYVLPLDGVYDPSIFDKGVVDQSTIDGKIYGSPGFSKDVLVVYYNKDLFSANNIAIPKSYDEFKQAADKLLEAKLIPVAYGGKDTVGNIFAAYTVGPSTLTPQWYQDAVAGKANFKDAKFVKTLSVIKEMADKGYYGKLYKGVDYAGAKLSFEQGKAAMIFTGSWDNNEFKKTAGLNYGAFFFPGQTAGDPIVGAQTNEAGFSVNAKTKYSEQAMRFIKYVASPAFYQIYDTMNLLTPPLSSVKVTDPIFADFQSATQWMPFYFSYFNKTEPSAQTKEMDGMQQVFFDKKTIQQIVEDIQSAVDRDFPQFKK